jgi:uncharacterized protein YdhG (YjbR/CyaY superfamily)
MNKPKTIDEYLVYLPEYKQNILSQIRRTIKQAVPEAEEEISYGMPSFRLRGNQVWVAANSKHIGFYPKVNGTDALKKELSKYRGTKGSVHFPYDKPIPYILIAEMVKFRFR